MNFFFLGGGVLSVLLSIAHGMWGERIVMPDLHASDAKPTTRTAAHITWHQISFLLLASGVVLLLMGMGTIPPSATIGVFLAAIVSGNYLLFIVFSVVKQPELLRQSAPQFVLFGFLIALIIIGTLRIQ